MARRSYLRTIAGVGRGSLPMLLPPHTPQWGLPHLPAGEPVPSGPEPSPRRQAKPAQQEPGDPSPKKRGDAQSPIPAGAGQPETPAQPSQPRQMDPPQAVAETAPLPAAPPPLAHRPPRAATQNRDLGRSEPALQTAASAAGPLQSRHASAASRTVAPAAAQAEVILPPPPAAHTGGRQPEAAFARAGAEQTPPSPAPRSEGRAPSSPETVLPPPLAPSRETVHANRIVPSTLLPGSPAPPPPASRISPRGTASESGGAIHIGRVDVHIAPPAAPPAKPAPGRPAPVSALARGFTAPFGLRQG